MAKETFRTRRNKPAGCKKEQKKQARMIEQDSEKTVTGTFAHEKSRAVGFPLRLVPRSKPKYFRSSVRPRDPKRKSEITLHTTRKLETLPAADRTPILPSVETKAQMKKKVSLNHHVIFGVSFQPKTRKLGYPIYHWSAGRLAVRRMILRHIHINSMQFMD